jgi:hypothetical protein
VAIPLGDADASTAIIATSMQEEIASVATFEKRCAVRTECVNEFVRFVSVSHHNSVGVAEETDQRNSSGFS